MKSSYRLSDRETGERQLGGESKSSEKEKRKKRETEVESERQ